MHLLAFLQLRLSLAGSLRSAVMDVDDFNERLHGGALFLRFKGSGDDLDVQLVARPSS